MSIKSKAQSAARKRLKKATQSIRNSNFMRRSKTGKQIRNSRLRDAKGRFC